MREFHASRVKMTRAWSNPVEKELPPASEPNSATGGWAAHSIGAAGGRGDWPYQRGDRTIGLVKPLDVHGRWVEYCD